MESAVHSTMTAEGRMPFYRSLAFKLGLCGGLLTLISVLGFAYFATTAQRKDLMRYKLDEALRFSEALTNIIGQSMGKYEIEGIDNLVQTLGRQEEVSTVRIFNHTGEVRFSTHGRELGREVSKRHQSCSPCHAAGHPLRDLEISKRIRFYHSVDGERTLGVITPIYNERSCFSAACHVHPESERMLGILDVGLSLEKTDRTVARAARKTLYFALALFLGITTLLALAVVSLVGKPVRRMVEATHQISRGEYAESLEISTSDELGELAESFELMSGRIRERERELERSRNEFQTLFENVPTYIAVVDRDYRIVQANRNFKSTFGYRIGEKCFSAYKGLDDKCQDCPVEKTFHDGSPHMSEEMGLTRKGEEIPYLVYTAPITTHEGEIQSAIEMSVDLRETKRLEKELRVSQDYLDNLVENSIHGILATDALGRIIIFNRAAERITGYTASEVVGSTDLERFLPAAFAQRVRAGLAGMGKADDLKIVGQETCLGSSRDQRIPVRFSGAILTENDKAIGAVGFFQDLRPFKALEREKAQAERLAVVGQTVAALAHGIKNIITGLEGGVYVIQTAMKRHDDGLLQKGWGMVERNIDKISHLVKDLLSYSRVGVAEIETVRANELAEEVYNLFKDKAHQSRIAFDLDLDPHLQQVNVDPKAIHTCLANLLSNALDACAEDEEKAEHRVVLRTRGGAQGVVFEVQDNGTGIDEDLRERLFTNFFTTKGTKGTGLGLMVTHKLVHEHGGTISVETQPGQGSCFRITIPQEASELTPEEASTVS